MTATALKDRPAAPANDASDFNLRTAVESGSEVIAVDKPSPVDQAPIDQAPIDQAPIDQAHLQRLAHRVLAAAKGTLVTRRAARNLAGAPGSPVRKTLVGLMDSDMVSEDRCQHAASLQVLIGQVILDVAGSRTLLSVGDLAEIPAAAHSIEAVGDAAVLITTTEPQTENRPPAIVP